MTDATAAHAWMTHAAMKSAILLTVVK